MYLTYEETLNVLYNYRSTIQRDMHVIFKYLQMRSMHCAGDPPPPIFEHLIPYYTSSVNNLRIRNSSEEVEGVIKAYSAYMKHLMFYDIRLYNFYPKDLRDIIIYNKKCLFNNTQSLSSFFNSPMSSDNRFKYYIALHSLNILAGVNSLALRYDSEPIFDIYKDRVNINMPSYNEKPRGKVKSDPYYEVYTAHPEYCRDNSYHQEYIGRLIEAF